MWFLFALLSAVTNAANMVFRRTKGRLAKPAELAWCGLAISVIPSFLLLYFSDGPLWTSHDFIMPMIAAATLNTFTAVLNFRAFRYSEASLVSPLTNLTPILLMVTSFIMFGIRPTPLAIVGVSMIAGGLYYISVNKRHGLLKPLGAIWHDRGARAMLGCVLIWSVSTNLTQIALRSASAALLQLMGCLISLFLLSLYVSVEKNHKPIKTMRRWWKHLLVVGIATPFSVYFQFRAMGLAPTSYVVAVKRFDVLIVIVVAGLIYKEKHVLKRFEGSVIALLGVVILYLGR